MPRFNAPPEEIIIDEDNDEDDSISLPGKGKTSETLREQLSAELGTDISNTADVDSVNLRIVKPKSGRQPFNYQKRLIGVLIITVIVIIALVAINVTIEYLIVSILTLFALGYVMAKKHDKPSYEAMVYIIIISFIILTGIGSMTNSGLNIYASTLIIFLLFVFYKMTNRRIVAVGVVLYIFWLIWSFIKVYKNEIPKFDNSLIDKVIINPLNEFLR